MSLVILINGILMMLLIGPFVFLTFKRYGFKGYWSHNPYEQIPEKARPWFRATLVILGIGTAVAAILWA